MIDRIASTMLAVLVALDQVIQTLIVAPFAIAGLAHVPNPDETISGLLGRHLDRWWARLPASLIDAAFLVLTLGRERDHCARAAMREMS
jgi:hypothetical protein